MSAATHTPGPWLRDRASGLKGDVRAASGKRIALCFGLREPRKRKGETPEAYRVRFERYRDECDANACRIVAAVNACEGIPIEILEAHAAGGLPWSVADQIDQRVLVARLVEAAQAAMNCIGELSPTQARAEVFQMLSSAIEKAPGVES